jgi:hypothetical protein
LNSSPLEEGLANLLNRLKTHYPVSQCHHEKPEQSSKGWEWICVKEECQEECQAWALNLQTAIVNFAKEKIPKDAPVYPAEVLTEITRNERNEYYSQDY